MALPALLTFGLMAATWRLAPLINLALLIAIPLRMKSLRALASLPA